MKLLKPNSAYQNESNDLNRIGKRQGRHENAAILAARIPALSDEKVAGKLQEFKQHAYRL